MNYPMYKEAVSRAYIANFAYHVKDDPIIDDAEYDQLFRSIELFERKHPNDILPNSPTRYVGMRVDGANDLGPFEHTSLMGSITNAFEASEVKAWYVAMLSAWAAYWSGTHPCPPITFTCEPKYDGLATSLHYNGGILIGAGTRGNGLVGEDVLANVLMIPDIPKEIPYKGDLEVRGEVYMLRRTLEAYNELAAKPLKNCRNGAAGTLRQSDPWIVTIRQLNFSAYALGDAAPSLEEHSGAMRFLADQGFPTCIAPQIATNYDELQFLIDTFAMQRPNLPMDTDGMVVKVNNRAFQKYLGYISRCPRWALAFKYPSDEVTTGLKSVTFQVGRTGKITPVAELVPVDVGGVTVSRATLHNMMEIERLCLATGFPVRVVRGGEVIPKIVGLGCDGNAHIGQHVVVPTHCPCCGSELERYPNCVDIYCVNPLCRDKIIQGLDYVASRSILDIDGVGPEVAASIADQLIGSGVYIHPLCILHLPLDLWITAAGKANGEKIYNQILSLRAGIKFSRFISALGIDGVGVSTAGKLARSFTNLDELQNADRGEFLEVEDVGGITADALTSFFGSDIWSSLSMALAIAEVIILDEIVTSRVMAGKTYVITGSFDMSRDAIKELVVSAGGRVSGTVSASTTAVIAGEAGGSKRDKAEQLGIPVISIDRLLDMFV